MMVSLKKSPVFIITYDDGEGQQVLKVPHIVFSNEKEFRKNIIQMKCLSCNFDSKFDTVEKEKVNWFVQVVEKKIVTWLHITIHQLH